VAGLLRHWVKVIPRMPGYGGDAIPRPLATLHRPFARTKCAKQAIEAAATRKPSNRRQAGGNFPVIAELDADQSKVV
jgi:hypothetical protein